MTEKPTYEELERRVQELEKAESKNKQAEEALKKSEENFRITFNNLQIGVVVHDKSGSVLFSNPTASHILGLTDKQILGKELTDPSWNFVNEDLSIMKVEDYPVSRVITTEQKLDFYQVGIQTKDRNYITWVIVNANPVFSDNVLDKIIVNFVNITERKQAEETLRKSDFYLQSVFDTAPVGICFMKDRVYQRVNSNWCDSFGYSEESLLGRTTEFLYESKKEYERVGQELYEHISEHGIAATQTKLKRIDGEFRDVDLIAKPLNSQDIADGVVVVVHDITERKQAELALMESETRFKALHNASFGGIAIHDQGVILECNQGLSEMMGYEYSELIGMDGLLLIADQSRKKVRNNIRAGYEKPYEALGLRKNGEEFSIGLEARNVPYKGKQVRTVEFRDLTEQKQAEAEQENLRARLNQAKKMESVGRLAGGVAHDFNNMLGVILGHLEFALEKAQEDNELTDDLNEIQMAAQRSADLTKQLLTFARKDIISPKKLNLNDTVESMLNMLRRLIGEDIDLIWQPAAHIWPVKMDTSQLDQILANLCINARDAISGVGKLTIETGRKSFDEEYCKQHAGFTPGDFVLLAVSDNGCGMDKEVMENLFEPFFTTKDVGQGTGLGVATIYGIVKQNNGFINVYSEPGQGTTFKIYLPRLIVEENTDEAVPEKKAAAGGTETILLVEDEPTILRMTRMMLEKKGYTVISAATPTEAVEKATSHSGSIDLLMTDVVMPEMNGRDLAGQIAELYPGIRLLFMSGYTANVIAHQGVLDDGVAFIQKPFSMADMTEKVREALDKG